MNKMKFRLSDSVFYRKYGNITVLYDTDRKKIFVFNAVAHEVIDYFKDYHSVAELADILSSKFGSDSVPYEQIGSFVDDLVSRGILHGENVLLENKNDVEAQFKHSADVQGRLLSVQIEMTFRCNEKCRHCYCVTENNREELSFEELKHLLDDLRSMDVFEVTFTGGDLFVRKDAFEILEYANSIGLMINVFTNGIALSDSDLIRLKSLHLKSIHFSVYSHIPEKHDYFTQVEGSFVKTTDVIRKCVLLGIPVNIKTCVMNYNADEIEGILELAEKLGTTVQVSMSISAKNDGDKTPMALRVGQEELYAAVMRKVNKHVLIHCSNELNEIRSSVNSAICGAGVHSLNINPYGDVFPCNALLIKCGNVREQNIRDIWEHSVVLKEIREFTVDKMKGCEGCSEVLYCNFCPGSALTETGDPLQRYDEACMLTKAKLIIKKEENNNAEI